MATQSNSESSIRCQHKRCVCDVPPGKSFCSDFCEKASGAMANLDPEVQVEPCACGHPKCGAWETKDQRVKRD